MVVGRGVLEKAEFTVDVFLVDSWLGCSFVLGVGQLILLSLGAGWAHLGKSGWRGVFGIPALTGHHELVSQIIDESLIKCPFLW